MCEMKMFPDSYDEFVQQYQTKEPKFGEYYIPATKVRQALEHYAAVSDEGISLEVALESNPYAVMAKALQRITENAVEQAIICVKDSCDQVSMDVEKIVDRAVQRYEDTSNHPVENKELETWTLKHSSMV